MSKGKLFVISGASGVGKSTVLNKVMAERSDLSFCSLTSCEFCLSLSHFCFESSEDFSGNSTVQ